LLYAVYIIFSGLDNGLFFQGYAADGSFQVYNPLRRMAAGQVIGRDFQFFHGIGIPLLLFPFFKLLGANLFASEVTRWLVSAAAFFISSLAFFKVMLKSWHKTILAIALTIIIIVPITNMVGPSNSLMGLRTCMPIVLAAIIAFNCSHHFRIRKIVISLQELVLVLALALTFFMSTEQGVYAIAAYFVFRLALLVRAKRLLSRQLIQLVAEAVGVVVLVLIIFTIATLGHPMPPLIYGLKTIPSQQFWYFGAPPNTFLTWRNLPSVALNIYKLWILIALVILLYRAVSRRFLLSSPIKKSLLFLSTYGLFTGASLLGYASFSQLFPAVKVVTTIGVGLGLILIDYKPPKKTSHLKLSKNFVMSMYMLGIAVLVGASGYAAYRVYEYPVLTSIRDFRAARHEPDRDFVTPYGWGKALTTFSQIDNAGQGQVWSTYSSLYEANLGIFNPADDGADYIIHALGPKDFGAYVQQFINQKPKYVITLRPDYFDYEQWLWTSNWPFYRQLLSHYTIVDIDASHYLWEYSGNTANKDGPWHKSVLTNNNVYLPAASASPVLYEVQLNYKTTTPFGILHSLPRYLLNPQQTGLKYAISLPPYETSWSFIVPVFPGNKAPSLHGFADGLIPGAKLKITSAKYHTLSVPSADLQPFIDNNELCPFKADSITTIYATCLQYR
jgi:hypothetical protein